MSGKVVVLEEGAVILTPGQAYFYNNPLAEEKGTQYIYIIDAAE